MFGLMVDIGLKFFISTNPIPGNNLGSRSRTFHECQKFCAYVYIAIPSRPFEEFHLYFTCW